MNLQNDRMMHGYILSGRGGLYTALDMDSMQRYVLRAKNKFRRERITPLVGDEIDFSPGTQSDEHGWIENIHPRKNSLIRPPVANISLLAILLAPVPEPDWLLVDRMLIIAHRQGIECLLIVSKSDLDQHQLYKKTKAEYRGAGCEVCCSSVNEPESLQLIKEKLHHEFTCFCGQSGVGKSTLLNHLFDLGAQTGQLSTHIQRGKNTTRHSELFCLKDCCVFDTPGFTFLEEEECMTPAELQKQYPEFALYADLCRFSPCMHHREPECAVKEAVLEGLISSGRYDRYLLLLSEAREKWKDRYS